MCTIRHPPFGGDAATAMMARISMVNRSAFSGIAVVVSQSNASQCACPPGGPAPRHADRLWRPPAPLARRHAWMPLFGHARWSRTTWLCVCCAVLARRADRMREVTSQKSRRPESNRHRTAYEAALGTIPVHAAVLVESQRIEHDRCSCSSPAARNLLKAVGAKARS